MAGGAQGFPNRRPSIGLQYRCTIVVRPWDEKPQKYKDEAGQQSDTTRKAALLCLSKRHELCLLVPIGSSPGDFFISVTKTSRRSECMIDFDKIHQSINNYTEVDVDLLWTRRGQETDRKLHKETVMRGKLH
jgi:hypothetical protein